jgi:hypothetical protein
MKIDELLKRLENFEIRNEKYEIAEYLVQTFGNKERQPAYHFMMKDKTIYDFDSYVNLLKSSKVSPDDAFVYVKYDYFTEYYPVTYFCPFFVDEYLLADVYLSKLGLKADVYHVVPATGLKYVAAVSHFLDVNRIVVEVADIDNVVTNTNLSTLIHSGVRNKHIDDGEVDKIVSRFRSQKLFAGYGFRRARKIIRKYYEDNDTSLAKDVEAIKDAYNRIFQPVRIECKRLQKNGG